MPKSNYGKAGMGAWIGAQDIWNHPLARIDSSPEVKRMSNATVTGNTVTEKQLAFMRSLFAERTQSEGAQALRQAALEAYKAGTLTKKDASEVIETALKFERDSKPTVDVPAFNEGDVVTNGTVIIRVKRSKQGNLYGLTWSGGDWVYSTGCLRTPNLHVMTAEEAASFGHANHFCVFCSRDLSDERSTEVGYGPICADKRGLPWG